VCDAFLKRIFDSGVTVVTSELLRLELAETAFANAMKERWAGKWRAHRTDGRSRPRAGRRMNDTISRYQALLAPVDHIPVPPGDITTVAIDFMTKYGLASTTRPTRPVPLAPAPTRSSRPIPASR